MYDNSNSYSFEHLASSQVHLQYEPIPYNKVIASRISNIWVYLTISKAYDDRSTSADGVNAASIFHNCFLRNYQIRKWITSSTAATQHSVLAFSANKNDRRIMGRNISLVLSQTSQTLTRPDIGNLVLLAL